MNQDIVKGIKILLAVLFLLCLLDMPYGFYMLVRTVGMIGFGLLAYQAFEEQDMTNVIVYIGLAILFQPLYKVALGRELWNIVDVGCAIYLIYTITRKKEDQ